MRYRIAHLLCIVVVENLLCDYLAPPFRALRAFLPPSRKRLGSFARPAATASSSARVSGAGTRVNVVNAGLALSRHLIGRTSMVQPTRILPRQRLCGPLAC